MHVGRSRKQPICYIFLLEQRYHLGSNGNGVTDSLWPGMTPAALIHFVSLYIVSSYLTVHIYPRAKARWLLQKALGFISTMQNNIPNRYTYTFTYMCIIILLPKVDATLVLGMLDFSIYFPSFTIFPDRESSGLRSQSRVNRQNIASLDS